MAKGISKARQAEKRVNPPKPRKKRERRADMRLIVSASQNDIYSWAVSLAIMAGVLVLFVTLAVMGGR